MAKKKTKSELSFGTMITVGLIVIFVTAGYFSLPWRTAQRPQRLHRQQPPVACTMEARLCPDGSAVGRSGPRCEFTPCPVVQTPEASNGITYSNEQYGFSLTLPDAWQGYKVATAENDNGTTVTLYFSGNGRRSFGIMQLDVYTTAQWRQVSAMAKQRLSTKVLPDGSIIALDYSPGCVQLDEFQCARSREVPGIFGTISFTPSA
jgi:hypothetical protein